MSLTAMVLVAVLVVAVIVLLITLVRHSASRQRTHAKVVTMGHVPETRAVSAAGPATLPPSSVISPHQGNADDQPTIIVPVPEEVAKAVATTQSLAPKQMPTPPTPLQPGVPQPTTVVVPTEAPTPTTAIEPDYTPSPSAAPASAETPPQTPPTPAQIVK